MFTLGLICGVVVGVIITVIALGVLFKAPPFF